MADERWSAMLHSIGCVDVHRLEEAMATAEAQLETKDFSSISMAEVTQIMETQEEIETLILQAPFMEVKEEVKEEVEVKAMEVEVKEWTQEVEVEAQGLEVEEEEAQVKVEWPRDAPTEVVHKRDLEEMWNDPGPEIHAPSLRSKAKAKAKGQAIAEEEP